MAIKDGGDNDITLPEVKLAMDEAEEVVELNQLLLQQEQQLLKQPHQPQQQQQQNVTINKWKDGVKVMYGVDEYPPVFLCLILAFQHYLSMCVATLTIPILLAPSICMFEDNVGKSEITGTLFVASGIITLVQSFVGVRLPIVQAGTYALLVPTLAYLSLPQWKCPDNIINLDNGNSTLLQLYSNIDNNNNSNSNNNNYIISGSDEHREIWKIRLREIQGCIMIAAIFEVVVGATGLVGFMMKFIGPLTICPTVTLLGLSLFKSAPQMASKHWGIALLSIFLVIVFSQYLGRIKFPCLVFSRSRGCEKHKFPLFKMFPIVLSIAITSLLCYILTVTNILPDDPKKHGYQARTDLRVHSIQAAPWFRIPYPGQWGMPTFSLSGVFAILSGVLATTIESVGDYYSCAKLAGAPPPPVHAINRGILVEGLGSILDGLFGTGNGTTSTSVNVGVVGITKVGSRVVIQVSALIMIIFGLFVKMGAIFLAIPDPIIGGTFFTLFGVIAAVGLSNLQHVNLNSSRNLFIIGFSLLSGLAIPEWVNSNAHMIDTGYLTLNNVTLVLLKTNMFVGGMIGFALDNTMPGSRKTRGMLYWDELRVLSQQQQHQPPPPSISPSSSSQQQPPPQQQQQQKTSSYLMAKLSATYDLPFSKYWLHRCRIFQHIPLCPNYRGSIIPADAMSTCCRGKNKNGVDGSMTSVCCQRLQRCNRRWGEDDEDEDDVGGDDCSFSSGGSVHGSGGGGGGESFKMNGFKSNYRYGYPREDLLITSPPSSSSSSLPPPSSSSLPPPPSSSLPPPPSSSLPPPPSSSLPPPSSSSSLLFPPLTTTTMMMMMTSTPSSLSPPPPSSLSVMVAMKTNASDSTLITQLDDDDDGDDTKL